MVDKADYEKLATLVGAHEAEDGSTVCKYCDHGKENCDMYLRGTAFTCTREKGHKGKHIACGVHLHEHGVFRFDDYQAKKADFSKTTVSKRKTSLTPKQIDNWRVALSTMIGPFAMIVSEEMIELFKQNLQAKVKEANNDSND